MQGEVGDCYVLSSLSALAEFPQRVEKIFLTQDLNSEGIYAVRLYIKGKPEIVTVDEKLPWISASKPMFARQNAEDQSWWIPIVEKAYAKVHGNYERLGLGWMTEAMRILTGAPSYQYMTNQLNESRVWEIAQAADQSGYLLTAATDHVSYGLAAGHAYTLLGCYEIKDSSGRTVEKLLRMRNPWATEKYNGPWNDRDTQWQLYRD